MRQLIIPADSVARENVAGFVERHAGPIAQHIALAAMQHLEHARLLGALTDEVGFTYHIEINTGLR